MKSIPKTASRIHMTESPPASPHCPRNVTEAWRRAGAAPQVAPPAIDPLDWPSLVAQYSTFLRATASRMGLSREETDDAVQRTWLKILERSDQVRDRRRFPGWLATIGRRECIDIRRERWALPMSVAEADYDSVDSGRTPEETLMHDEERRLVNAAIDELPARERSLIKALLAPSEPSYADVACELDMPVGSIGPIRKRALMRLRLSLSQVHDHAPAQASCRPRARLGVCDWVEPEPA